MSTSPARPEPGTQEPDAIDLADRPGAPAYHRAMLSLLLFVVSFLLSTLAFSLIWRAAGYTTIWATQYPVGPHSPSGWTARGIWLLLTALYAWPLVVVVFFALKARGLGHAGWPLPVILGSVLAIFFPLLNVALLIG